MKLFSRARIMTRIVIAKLLRRPPPVIDKAARLQTAAATIGGLGEVINPTGDEANIGIWAILRSLFRLHYDAEEKRAQDKRDEERSRTVLALCGLASLVLFTIAMIMMALSR